MRALHRLLRFKRRLDGEDVWLNCQNAWSKDGLVECLHGPVCSANLPLGESCLLP
jgi:hypothetical protein